MAWTVSGPDAGTSVRSAVSCNALLMFPSGATTMPGPSALPSTVAAPTCPSAQVTRGPIVAVAVTVMAGVVWPTLTEVGASQVTCAVIG